MELFAYREIIKLNNIATFSDWILNFRSRKSMKAIIILYIFNATLLLLHEIESGYEREWEILKLPGRISGFLLLHIPIILLIFYGLLELYKQTEIGLVLGMILGVGGLIPFVVHKVFVRRKDRFDSILSNIIIYLNILTGIALIILAYKFM